MNYKYILCVCLAAGLFYTSVMVYQCSTDSFCSVKALDVFVGDNTTSVNGKGNEPISISNKDSVDAEKQIIIKTDAVPSPPPPRPPRRSH